MPASHPTRDRSGVSFISGLARHGARPALLTSDAALTYAQLSERGDDIARLLRPEAGRRLALVGARNRPAGIEAYLGAMRAGHVVLLVDGDDTGSIDSMVDAYDPDLLLLPSEPGSETWKITDRRDRSAHALHPELALLLSTSGSTGSPKLVRLSQQNLQANADAIASYLQLTVEDRAATTLPMSYCYGLSVMHSHLLAGAGLVLTELSVVDECFWDLFRARAATSFAGVPYTFELLQRVNFAQKELPSLRYVTQAGGRLAPESVAAYADLGRSNGWDFYVMYGQTEATARMAYLPPSFAAASPGSIGLPIPGGSFRIDPVADAPRDAGELVYQGPNVMLGYAESPADLALGRTVQELRTGDIARRGSTGFYEIVGRRAAFAKVRGLRIDLEQAERTLAGVGTRVACAAGNEEVIVGIESPLAEADVRPRLVETLGLPNSAVRVVCLPELPRLANGKPDRAKLAEIASASQTTPVEGATVQQLYTDVLGRPAGEADTFVSLGGDSLSYVEVSLGLEQMLGQLPAGWASMTVAQLQGLAPADRRERSRSRVTRSGMLELRRIETSVLLRALAITLVVATHAGLVTITGGAHLLLAVAGYNFARFQLTAASRLDRLRSQVRAIARVVAPAVLWIGTLLLLTSDYELHSLFLLNAVVGATTWTNGWQFWFIEVLTYLLIAAAVLTSIPLFDRAERRWPFAVPMAVLGLGLILRFGFLDLGVPNTKPALWLFALGWAASRADRNWQRGTLLIVAALAVPGFFGDLQREALILSGFGLLLLVRSVPVPALAAPLAGVLASSSLYIYLVHWRVYPALEAAPQAVAVVASLAAGVAAWLAIDRGLPVLRRALVVAYEGAVNAARAFKRRLAPEQVPLMYWTARD